MLLQEAADAGSAVMAFNVVDPASMTGVLDAAVRADAPVVVQVSVKSVRQWGVSAVLACYTEASRARSVRSVLHLDHCTDPDLAAQCLRAGWDSVLFDASQLSYEEAVDATRALVHLASRHGADIEGEFEAIPRVGQEPARRIPDPLDRAVSFVRATGVTCFSPDLGTAHGAYRQQPSVDFDRARALSAAVSVPLVLHGGSGLDFATMSRLVDCGVRKINVSTQIKQAYLDACSTAVRHGELSEPLVLLERIRSAVRDTAASFIREITPVPSAGVEPHIGMADVADAR